MGTQNFGKFWKLRFRSVGIVRLHSWIDSREKKEVEREAGKNSCLQLIEKGSLLTYSCIPFTTRLTRHFRVSPKLKISPIFMWLALR